MSGYLAEVLSIAASMEPGTCTRITVLHDDWCSLLIGRGPCDCEPDYIIRADDVADAPA